MLDAAFSIGVRSREMSGKDFETQSKRSGAQRHGFRCAATSVGDAIANCSFARPPDRGRQYLTVFSKPTGRAQFGRATMP